MDCLVRERTSTESSIASGGSSSYGFSVELEALSIVHSPLSGSENTACAAVDSPIKYPSVANTADVSLSNAEFTDLGDALASMLASGGDDTNQHVPDDTQATPTSSLASSCSLEDSVIGQDSDAGSATASPPSRRKSSTSSESDEENATSGSLKSSNKVIKLPQRKGGMQLWQFLYALLSDPKYKELIEWTSNVKEREFRLHEPEAIAIWWGDHKNKRNMSYDKLSRSLRYYYDKGIIRKINGQRYVYRFCVAPEVMYRHIGNSDCRPKLKPMSLAAQNAMSTYNNTYQGMMYPPHGMQPQPLPSGIFNNQYFPPPYPAVHASSYPPFSSAGNLVPAHPSFPQPTHSSLEYSNFLQMSSYPTEPFQPHLSPPIEPAHGQPSYNTTHDSFRGATSGNFLNSFPMSMEDATFHPLMTDGTPSPQPISSPSSLHSGTTQQSPSLTSPLYNCANPWDSFLGSTSPGN